MIEMTKDQLRERYEQNEELCCHMIQLLGLMSHKVRFRILCMLAHGNFTVGDMVEVVAPGKTSLVSHQLRMLNLFDLVDKHREGKSLRYFLKDERLREHIAMLESQYLMEEVS